MTSNRGTLPRSLRATRILRRGAVGLVFVVLSGSSGCTCKKGDGDGDGAEGQHGDDGSSGIVSTGTSVRAGNATGLSAPIAAAHLPGGDVLVAGLDVPSRAIRVQRINPADEVALDRIVLDGVAWSSEADLRIAAAGSGAAVTWRGLRRGKLGRQLVVLGADLGAKAAPVDVVGASCATRDGIWFTDGRRAHGQPWSGAPIDVELPRDKEAAIVCGATRAFALLDEDDGTSVIELGVKVDGGPGGARAVPARLLREADFGDDEQRERAEFTVGDELGVVRVGVSGALAVREGTSPARKLKTSIPQDDDVVAVDASPNVVVVVYTHDASDTCSEKQGGNIVPSTKVFALRVDRKTGEETKIELSPGQCSREVGPFFTSAVGGGVSVAWVERVPVAGKARAPISGLAHALVPATGAPEAAKRIEQQADALVDAGCDESRCYAAALTRKPGMDAMVPGVVRVLRYR